MADNKERIFFGSLEAKEKERLEGKGTRSSVPSPPQAQEHLPFSAAAVESQAKHNQQMHKLELHRRARSIVVPTNDEFVKAKLREIGQPIILFGEKPEDRRERLRDHLAKLGVSDGFPAGTKEAGSKQKREDRDKDRDQQDDNEGYLTPGVPELKGARLWIASYSIPKAKARVSAAKRRREQPPPTNFKDSTKESFSRFINSTSEIGDERPMSAIGFAPNSKFIATGGWSGSCKLWEISGSTCRHITTFRGHSERIHDLAFHPRATLDLSPSVVNFATSSSDRTVRCWSLASDDEANGNGNSNDTAPDALKYLISLASLTGHEDRVNGVEFHPSGRYIGSCSSDKTWRLWDVETKKELLLQEGHSKAIHAISFHIDGSLVATGGEDNAVRVWDLRSGRPLWSFPGHVKQIVDIDWSPNGYQLASASDDHSVRIWDLRKRRNAYILTAHSSLISSVRYQKSSEEGLGGDFLITASFDNSCKIWDAGDWSAVKILAGHECRVMAADISPNSKYIASAAYDRTWKLWCDETDSNQASNDAMVL
jgi:U4/U6 small nuclear ribonucleoprotein PRP4